MTFRDMISNFNPAFKAEVNERLQTLKKKKQTLKTKNNSGAIEEQISYLDKKN